MIVMDMLCCVLESQYAKHGPAMPAPDTRTLILGSDIVLCCLLRLYV